MKYKVIKNEKGEILGIAVDEKGFPIVIQEKDGVENEIGLDAIHLYGKVPGLMAEAKGHRLAAEEANKVINLFKEREVGDIPTFLEKGLAALETVGNLEEGKLPTFIFLDTDNEEFLRKSGEMTIAALVEIILENKDR